VSGRLLVVGASGLVGSEVMHAASRWSTHGVARNVSGLATEAMDLLDQKSIERVVNHVNPDAVVVASAWPWVDGCEQDPARSQRENVQTVKNLLEVLGHSARVVFFSTEHVFDGLAPAYDENAPTHPLSVYAKHKRAVEELLLARGKSLVARTSYVFGNEVRRKNFMYRVIDASEQKTPLKVPSAQAGMPTWSRWLAASAMDLLGRGFEGIAHLTGPDVLTKAEWARMLADGLALPNVEIVEVPWQESGQIAPRPERVRLLSTRHELHHPPLLELLTRERAALLSKVN
jgi:dTDP-4-dehydrorhamnose reductase